MELQLHIWSPYGPVLSVLIRGVASFHFMRVDTTTSLTTTTTSLMGKVRGSGTKVSLELWYKSDTSYISLILCKLSFFTTYLIQITTVKQCSCQLFKFVSLPANKNYENKANYSTWASNKYPDWGGVLISGVNEYMSVLHWDTTKFLTMEVGFHCICIDFKCH